MVAERFTSSEMRMVENHHPLFNRELQRLRRDIELYRQEGQAQILFLQGFLQILALVSL